MSAITIDNDLVHYEVLGRGRPVILVHGWLSSWRYWIPTMQQLSMKYRTYALDLWGYGDSGKNPERFSLEAHVKLLDDFMEKMGIPKAALIGHSLGAAVVIRYALQRPERAARLMAISAPVFESVLGGEGESTLEAPSTPAAPDSATQPDAGQPNTAPAAQPPAASPAEPETPETGQTGNPSPAGESDAPTGAADQAATQPLEPAPPPSFAAPTVPRRPAALDIGLGGQLPTPEISISPQDLPRAEEDSPAKAADNPLRARLMGADARQLLERHLSREVPDFDKLGLEAAKTAPTALAASALSFDGVELAHDVRRLSSPTLLVHGEKDTFLPPPSRRLIEYLARDKNDFRCVIWPETDHFPMLVDPSAFHRLVMDFLEAADLDDLEFKERWVRKVR